MKIRQLASVYLTSTVIALSLLILLSSAALNSMRSIADADRDMYTSLKLSNELLQSSEDLTIMARNYVVTRSMFAGRSFFSLHECFSSITYRP